MTPFTEAHFAATLLHCGPHICGIKNIHTPPADEYLNRVYSYFFVLFPTKVEFFDTKNVKHEWFIFWDEYRAWVES